MVLGESDPAWRLLLRVSPLHHWPLEAAAYQPNGANTVQTCPVLRAVELQLRLSQALRSIVLYARPMQYGLPRNLYEKTPVILARGMHVVSERFVRVTRAALRDAGNDADLL